MQHRDPRKVSPPPMDLTSILKNAAASLGEKTAIVSGDRRISFASLEKDANRVANALIKMGVKKGDRVAMMQANSPEFVAVFFGIIKAGAIAVPLDSRYVADELDSLFNDCTPKVFFIEKPPLEALLPALARFTSIEHIVTVNYQQDKRFISYEECWHKTRQPALACPLPRKISPSYPIPAGPPTNLTASPCRTGAFTPRSSTPPATFRQTEKDVMMLFALPMYHQFGLTAVLLASLYTGNNDSRRAGHRALYR